MHASRNAPCPCGSGRKYKHCHGAPAKPRTGSARLPLEQARDLHRKGYLSEAEMLYREVLERSPRNADAMHMLGIALQDLGRIDEAIETHRRAVLLRPQDRDAHAQLLFS